MTGKGIGAKLIGNINTNDEIMKPFMNKYLKVIFCFQRTQHLTHITNSMTHCLVDNDCMMCLTRPFWDIIIICSHHLQFKDFILNVLLIIEKTDAVLDCTV